LGQYQTTKAFSRWAALGFFDLLVLDDGSLSRSSSPKTETMKIAARVHGTLDGSLRAQFWTDSDGFAFGLASCWSVVTIAVSPMIFPTDHTMNVV